MRDFYDFSINCWLTHIFLLIGIERWRFIQALFRYIKRHCHPRARRRWPTLGRNCTMVCARWYSSTHNMGGWPEWIPTNGLTHSNPTTSASSCVARTWIHSHAPSQGASSLNEFVAHQLGINFNNCHHVLYRVCMPTEILYIRPLVDQKSMEKTNTLIN